MMLDDSILNQAAQTLRGRPASGDLRRDAAEALVDALVESRRPFTLEEVKQLLVAIVRNEQLRRAAAEPAVLPAAI